MSVPVYRRKPIEVQAVQVSHANLELLNAFGFGAMVGPVRTIPASGAADTCGEAGPDYLAVNVRDAHGELVTARHGEWVVPDSKPGTLTVVTVEDFAAGYEPAAAEPKASVPPPAPEDAG